MSSRRRSRELAMQVLFQMEICGDNSKDAIELFDWIDEMIAESAALKDELLAELRGKGEARDAN